MDSFLDFAVVIVAIKHIMFLKKENGKENLKQIEKKGKTIKCVFCSLLRAIWIIITPVVTIKLLLQVAND